VTTDKLQLLLAASPQSTKFNSQLIADLKAETTTSHHVRRLDLSCELRVSTMYEGVLCLAHVGKLDSIPSSFVADFSADMLAVGM
jgi:predicted signal transduction protein with EAL and GGDEF domain